MTEGYIVKETKDFIPTGKYKPTKRITIAIAFWPLNSRRKMDEVIENMMLEKPDSGFEIERIPVENT